MQNYTAISIIQRLDGIYIALIHSDASGTLLSHCVCAFAVTYIGDIPNYSIIQLKSVKEPTEMMKLKCWKWLEYFSWSPCPRQSTRNNFKRSRRKNQLNHPSRRPKTHTIAEVFTYITATEVLSTMMNLRSLPKKSKMLKHYPLKWFRIKFYYIMLF